MKLVVLLVLLVFTLLRVRAQESGPSTFAELYQQRLGITLSPLEEAALNQWYPKDTWQREWIFREFTDENLEALLTWQYYFQADTHEALDRKKALVADYLQQIGLPELMRKLKDEEEITTSPLEALKQDNLVEIGTAGCIVVIDDTQPIRVRPETESLVQALVDKIRSAGLCEYLRTTGSYRPPNQTRLLAAFGFAAPSETETVHPAAVGRSVTLALEGMPYEGPYRQFLESISDLELAGIRQHVEAGEYPTIANLLKWGVIFDPNFMAFWDILESSGFTIIDITGFQSVTAGPNGLVFVRVNPTIVLVDARTSSETE
jgi:hypothetical protein